MSGESPQLRHIKRTAKRIKKKYPHIKLMVVQHDLALHLNFGSWKDMLHAMPEELQKRIDKKGLSQL